MDIKRIEKGHGTRQVVCCRGNLPSVDIVYDHYHISAMINRAVDDLRRQEHHQAENEQKQVMQGSRVLLFRNYETLGADSQDRLQSLLEVNQAPLTMYTMKDQLRSFWTLPNRKDPSSFLYTWCFDAMDSCVKQLVRIGLTLTRYRNGILNYFSHPITNAVAEVLNKRPISVR
ncbi:MAG: transposase [Desulfoprunum sp.]|jgi:transposase